LVVWWGWLLFMFFKRFSSDEYLQLKQEVESLKISYESLKITLDLLKHKFRVKAKIDEDIEENTSDNKFNKVLLPDR